MLRKACWAFHAFVGEDENHRREIAGVGEHFKGISASEKQKKDLDESAKSCSLSCVSVREPLRTRRRTLWWDRGSCPYRGWRKAYSSRRLLSRLRQRYDSKPGVGDIELSRLDSVVFSCERTIGKQRTKFIGIEGTEFRNLATAQRLSCFSEYLFDMCFNG